MLFVADLPDFMLLLSLGGPLFRILGLRTRTTRQSESVQGKRGYKVMAMNENTNKKCHFELKHVRTLYIFESLYIFLGGMKKVRDVQVNQMSRICILTKHFIYM